jgi:hypothetical protein
MCNAHEIKENIYIPLDGMLTKRIHTSRSINRHPFKRSHIWNSQSHDIVINIFPWIQHKAKNLYFESNVPTEFQYDKMKCP